MKRKTRKGLAALILGANMPDIDVFFGWVPWEPLATHRGFTHGLVGGVALLPPVLAGLLWLLDRWQVGRGAEFKSGLEMHFGWLMVLSYLGALTHPLLDWQNTYAVQLMSPFSDLWFHNDSLFIIDVWVWTGMAFAIWLSRRRERRGGSWRRPAIVACAAMIAYITANGVLTQAVKNRIRPDEAVPQPDAVFASPPPAWFWKRDVVWRENGLIGSESYDWLTQVDSSAPEPDGMDDPLVGRAMHANSAVIAFMRWSTMTTAEIARERCRALVRFRDARYGGNNSFTHTVELPLEGTGCPPPASD